MVLSTLDTIESVLKNESLNNQQKQSIDKTLAKCRYSKLKYNKIIELKSHVTYSQNYI